MKQYLNLLSRIKTDGVDKTDRTGTGTKSIFGHQMSFDLSKGFPLVTTKKIHFKSIVHELIWKLSGDTNTKYLKDNGVSIWDEWADENGDVGPVYGHQMRKFGYTEPVDNGYGYRPAISGFDQINFLQKEIQRNPDSRRHIMTLWNPHDVPKQKLPPCPCFYQFESHDGILSLLVYQRSVDTFLGLPFNIGQEALLLLMMSQVVGQKAGSLIWTGGDVHIYNNHRDQTSEQLSRVPLALPRIELNPDIKNVTDFRYEDIKLLDYNHHPHIKGDVAV